MQEKSSFIEDFNTVDYIDNLIESRCIINDYILNMLLYKYDRERNWETEKKVTHRNHHLRFTT